MQDPELQAIADILKTLSSLTEAQQRSVLSYVNQRHGVDVPTKSVNKVNAPDSHSNTATSDQFASIGEFFDAAKPDGQCEIALVVAYWLQEIERADSFEAAEVNAHMKHLGRQAKNITNALTRLSEQQPRLVIQIRKEGSTKQARKKYKVTREGVKKVKAMLMSKEAADNDD